jgi:hypothetical protein
VAGATENGGERLESTRIILLRQMQSHVAVLSQGRYDCLEVINSLVVAVCWLLHRELTLSERTQGGKNLEDEQRLIVGTAGA